MRVVAMDGFLAFLNEKSGERDKKVPFPLPPSPLPPSRKLPAVQELHKVIVCVRLEPVAMRAYENFQLQFVPLLQLAALSEEKESETKKK